MATRLSVRAVAVHLYSARKTARTVCNAHVQFAKVVQHTMQYATDAALFVSADKAAENGVGIFTGIVVVRAFLHPQSANVGSAPSQSDRKFLFCSLHVVFAATCRADSCDVSKGGKKSAGDVTRPTNAYRSASCRSSQRCPSGTCGAHEQFLLGALSLALVRCAHRLCAGA